MARRSMEALASTSLLFAALLGGAACSDSDEGVTCNAEATVWQVPTEEVGPKVVAEALETDEQAVRDGIMGAVVCTKAISLEQINDEADGGKGVVVRVEDIDSKCLAIGVVTPADSTESNPANKEVYVVCPAA